MFDFWRKKFDDILIDRAIKDSVTARRFLNIFPDKTRIVDGEPEDMKKGSLTASEFSRSKRQIFVTRFKGRFFKKCPGFHKGMACCNYFVLNLGFQCDMDCSYCYLQSFINSSHLTVYSNIEEALAELKSMNHLKDQPLRIGTGEVMDSLSLDPITLHSRQLIDFFKNYPLWKLEFKTKSAFVDQFLDCHHQGNIICSWSINPSPVIESEESGTASLNERLEAAEKCVARGFQVAFHIDPMIWHPDWKENYADLIKNISQRFSPEQIPYLSVGALRYPPHQKNIMRERFKMNNLVNRAETFLSQDGKLRYDSRLRQKMFDFVMKTFHRHNSHWKIFMCMETPETWIQTLGHSPHREKPLKPLFQPIVYTDRNQEPVVM